MFRFVFACGGELAFDSLENGFIFPAGAGLPVAVKVDGEQVSWDVFKRIYNLDRE